MTLKTKPKEQDDDLSGAMVVIVGTIFLIVLLFILFGIAFTWLFNSFFVPIFLPELAPISVQQGVGLYLTLWFVLNSIGKVRSR